VTERGLPLADGAPACPFVAFDDDRDERASVPDHRHRCYADQRPAPRALAHQEAYCLSSAFPVCPTFQDWARREAARSRDGAATAPSASAGMNRAASGAAAADAVSSGAGPGADEAPGGAVGAAGAAAAAGATVAGAAAAGGDATAPSEGTGAGAAAADRPAANSPDVAGADDRASDDAADRHADDGVRRNPPRDWAAPPPWLASTDRRRDDDADPPAFLGRRASEPGQGLAGSPADRMAGGPPPSRPAASDEGVWSSDSRSAAAIGAGLGAGAAGSSAGGPTASGSSIGRRHGSTDIGDHDDHGDHDGHDVAHPIGRRPRAYAQHLGGADGPDGPDWERPRRFEAYPSIKTRVGMPAIPRTLALFGLVIVIAIALLLLPSLLNLGGGTASPAGSAGASQRSAPSVSFAPTAIPAPTPIVYVIKHNDTLLKIATAHGITVAQLMAANPTIKNPNIISEGQQITIPAPSDAPPDTIGASASP
jgi:hypothetical protein